MANDLRYTVLGKAEQYIDSSVVARGGNEPPPLRTVEQARELLRPQFQRLISETRALPKDARLDEVVVELRLDKQYLAKTYHPSALLRATGLELRGVGTWEQETTSKTTARLQRKTEELGEHIVSRSLFVSGTDAAINAIGRAVDGRLAGTDGDIIKIDAIRLPTAEDRMPRTDPRAAAVEVVLFAWDRRHSEDAVKRIRAVLRKHGVEDEKHVRVKRYVDGPTFIAAVAPPPALLELGGLNYLRIAKPLPRVALTRTATGMQHAAPPAPVRTTQPIPRLAIYDGGTTASLPHLAPWVQVQDLTTEPPRQGDVEHGTAVAGAALYGSLRPDDVLEEPTFGVLAFRVLPDPVHDALELYGVIDALEKSVETLPAEVRVVNLSFGPAGPIDTTPSRFTYAIDRLHFQSGRLFFTAVGNWGDRKGALARVQSPSDSVVNIAVGAYRVEPTTAEFEPATYSCRGPGRAGGVRKPDIVAFGGCPTVPFNVLESTAAGKMVGVQGTSFACPVAAALAAETLARVRAPLSAQSLRALMIHAARPHLGPPEAVGYGLLARDVEAILGCTKRRVSVLYSGTITPRAHWKMPFLLPDDFNPQGGVKFSWTFTYAPPVDFHATDEYTLAGIELQFRPHANRHAFTLKGTRERQVVDVVKESALAAQLMATGFRPSAEPVSDGGGVLTERERRTVEAKWETIVRGNKSKRADGVHEPCLTVAIIGRGAWDQAHPDLTAPFAAVLTVEAPKYSGDLYQDVLAARNRLEPVGLRTRAEARAQNRIRRP